MSISSFPSRDKPTLWNVAQEDFTAQTENGATECPFCCIPLEACAHSQRVTQIDTKGVRRCNVAFRPDTRLLGQVHSWPYPLEEWLRVVPRNGEVALGWRDEPVVDIGMQEVNGEGMVIFTDTFLHPREVFFGGSVFDHVVYGFLDLVLKLLILDASWSGNVE